MQGYVFIGQLVRLVLLCGSHFLGLGLKKGSRRQLGRVVRAPDSKSRGCRFKSHSDHQLDLFPVVPNQTPQLHLKKANWSALSWDF